MTTKELAHNMIDNLNDVQLLTLIAFLDRMQHVDHDSSGEIESLCGIFHDAANSDLALSEKGAWEGAAAEKYKNNMEDTSGENS